MMTVKLMHMPSGEEHERDFVTKIEVDDQYIRLYFDRRMYPTLARTSLPVYEYMITEVTER